MRRFLFKTFLFFLPFLLILAMKLFVLPIDFFTIRPWEAVIVRKMKMLLPGPFYPYMKINRIEQGDVARYS